MTSSVLDTAWPAIVIDILSHLEGRWSLRWISKNAFSLSHVLFTFTENQSFRVKGSCVFFLRPFLLFERRLFLETTERISCALQHGRIFFARGFRARGDWGDHSLADRHIRDVSDLLVKKDGSLARRFVVGRSRLWCRNRDCGSSSEL